MRSLIMAFLFLGQGIACASYFEFCALTGQIASAPLIRDGELYFSFYVTSAVPAKCRLAESYTPQVCATYQNSLLEIGLPASDKEPLKQDAALTVIQLVWYADIAPETGYRVTWKLPGECQAVHSEAES